ncbi:MAG: hypothetical protein JKY01_10715 [Pseudomonadales bacterium]|nr:hypothetical protein [Pseudomonadales bacterium]
MSNKKQNVSVRLSESDIKKIKGISARLGVKDSELFRYIIKNSLSRLLPFQQNGMSGIDLIPALLDSGKDLTQHLDIDTERLDRIVNDGVSDEDRQVDKGDLDFVTLLGNNGSHDYLTFKLRESRGSAVLENDIDGSLKEYLYSKYLGGEPVTRLNRKDLTVY